MLSDNLEKYRLEKGYSRRQLAFKAGVSRETIFNIETGKRRTTYDTILKLSKGLGIPIEDLVK